MLAASGVRGEDIGGAHVRLECPHRLASRPGRHGGCPAWGGLVAQRSKQHLLPSFPLEVVVQVAHPGELQGLFAVEVLWAGQEGPVGQVGIG